jgi:hypothetical protein
MSNLCSDSRSAFPLQSKVFWPALASNFQSVLRSCLKLLVTQRLQIQNPARSEESANLQFGQIAFWRHPQAAINAAAVKAQADYDTGRVVPDPATGTCRRTRMFVLTLGFSRK